LKGSKYLIKSSYFVMCYPPQSNNKILKGTTMGEAPSTFTLSLNLSSLS